MVVVPFPDTFAAADFTLRDRAQRDQEAARMLDYISTQRARQQQAAAQQQELALRQRTETRLEHADELVEIQRRAAMARDAANNLPYTAGDLDGAPAAQMDMAGNSAPSAALPEPNRLATGALGANARTGIATTFGLNPDGSIDKQDNGVGFRGANTRNPSLVGVALHASDLMDAGIPKSQWDKTQVAVKNPATGKAIVAPVVDLLGNPNAAVDLTYGATKALGTTGKDKVEFSIAGIGNQRPRPNVSLGNDYQSPSTTAADSPAAQTQATPSDLVQTAHQIVASRVSELKQQMQQNHFTQGEAKKTLQRELPQIANSAINIAAKLHGQQNGVLDTGEVFKTADEAVAKVNEYSAQGVRAAAVPTKTGYRIRTYADAATVNDDSEVLKTSDDVLQKINEYSDQGIPAHSVAVKGGFKVVTGLDRPTHLAPGASLVKSSGDVIYQNPAKVPAARQADQQKNFDAELKGYGLRRSDMENEDAWKTNPDGSKYLKIKNEGAPSDYVTLKPDTLSILLEKHRALKSSNGASAPPETSAPAAPAAPASATTPTAGAAPASAVTAPASKEVPPEYIDYLRKHPDKAASFDLKFGQGASARYLAK